MLCSFSKKIVNKCEFFGSALREFNNYE